MRKKFDICFIMAKENTAFRTYPVLHKLKIQHAIDFGLAHKTKNLAKMFTHYIAKAQLRNLGRNL